MAATAKFSLSAAFAPIHHYANQKQVLASPFPCFAVTPLQETGSPEMSADPYTRIGISKEELAIGIDASEFLQWIGS
jgi:hypothetical protein